MDHGSRRGKGVTCACVYAMSSALPLSPDLSLIPFTWMELPFVVERAFLLFSKLKFIKRYSNIWR